MSGAKVDSNVVDVVILLTGCSAEDFPKPVGLRIVIRCDITEEGRRSFAGPLLVGDSGLDWFVSERSIAAGIIGVGAVVAVDGHRTIPLEGIERFQRRVHWYLLVVDAEAVAMCIRVGEQPRLEDRVG